MPEEAEIQLFCSFTESREVTGERGYQYEFAECLISVFFFKPLHDKYDNKPLALLWNY